MILIHVFLLLGRVLVACHWPLLIIFSVLTARKPTPAEAAAAARLRQRFLLGVGSNYLYTIERGLHEPSAPLTAKFEELVRAGSVFTLPALVRRIPILSHVQAGEPTAYEELPRGYMDWLDCLCPDPQAFAVKVVGESMLPEYAPGSLAVCMPSYPPVNGGLAVAKMGDDAATLKTVKFRGQRPKSYRLVPSNPDFKTRVVHRAALTWLYPVHSVMNRCRQ